MWTRSRCGWTAPDTRWMGRCSREIWDADRSCSATEGGSLLYAADPVRAVDSGVFPVPAGAQTLAQALLARHGDAVQAILLYGSCYRRGDDREGIVDLYLLVDDYRSVHGTG